MFNLWERLMAWTWGLPEYAQFFLWVALICLTLAVIGLLAKEIGRYKDQRRAERLARRILQDYGGDGGTWDDSWGREYDECHYICDEPLHDHHDGCPGCYMSAHEQMIYDRIHGD